ncbi:MAG: biotin--[acetyl-CoA-carboxylase] ligase [Candidatus Cryptobacteroides sp.]
MTNKHSILWLDNVDSTNLEARRRISDIDNLSVLSARTQTKGRGQRGNSWVSSPGENLTFSIVLKFGGHHSQQMQAYDQFAISQMAALSVVDFLAEHGIEAEIKWPNDIYVDNRKICGMLIENSLNGGWLSWSIIGIGINVNQTDFPETLVNPTSMALQTGQKYDVESLLPQFLEIFEGYRSRCFHINGGLCKLRQLYHAQLWRMNRMCTFVDYTTSEPGYLEGPVNIVTEGSEPQGTLFTGTVMGVSDTGKLVIGMKEGYSKEFGFKEIGWVL